MQPPINAKFAAYGGTDFSVDTELKGIVVAVWGTELYVAPYTNYDYLLIEGNRRRPLATEDCAEKEEKTLCGWVFYRDNVIANQGINPPPIIKMETYAVGGRPDPVGDNPAVPPKVRDVVTGEVREIRVHDHIRVSGLYVIDYSHTMYYKYATSSFSYMRGLYKAAFAHAEFHPYNYNSIELITNLGPGAQLHDEVHTVVAPVYQEFYVGQYWWNKVGGVAQHLVDSSKQETRSASFFIKAPPKPGFDYRPRFAHYDVLKLGQGQVTVSPSEVTDLGVSVKVNVTGKDLLNPLIYRAKYAVQWVPPGDPMVDPQCAQIRARLAELHAEVLALQEQKAGLDPMDLDSRVELMTIDNQIKILQAEITNLQLQASALGCPP